MMSFTYRLFRGAAVLLLALSAAIATPAIEFVLTGNDLYPMRWGLVEDTEKTNDDVLSPHSVGGPITCKKDITPSLIVTRRTTDPEIVWWQVLSASLKNKAGTVTYWTIGQSPQLSPGQSWPLGKMRPHIEHAKLHVQIIALVNPNGGGTDNGDVRMSQLEVTKATDVYTVLSQPLAPMGKPWASFMPYVCDWGHGTATIEDAARALTLGLFAQSPGIEYPLPPDTTDKQFYPGGKLRLKRVLDTWVAGFKAEANCLDVSAVLSVAHAAVGIDSSMVQYKASPGFPSGANAGSFLSNPLRLIGRPAAAGYSSTYWDWHSVVTFTMDVATLANEAARIFDACAARPKDPNGGSYDLPPAWHPSGALIRWRLSIYWYTGDQLGLVGSPAQSLPPSPIPKLTGRPGVTTF